MPQLRQLWARTIKSMIQHTPGPWKIGPHLRCEVAGEAISFGKHGAVAVVLDAAIEAQANARLIAAAPEMLKFVELVATFFGRDGDNARALITKMKE